MSIAVLILVLMEDTLRDLMKNGAKSVKSLNPCFNGRYSQSMKYIIRILAMIPSLNPCFNGRYSQRWIVTSLIDVQDVLILVLMEDTLRVLHFTK